MVHEHSEALLVSSRTNIVTVQNEDLKNLMMSWYYAGYYTGFYEGKQQGYASAMQRQEG
jgi:hypothetical protein